jgi:hypothetical protein
VVFRTACAFCGSVRLEARDVTVVVRATTVAWRCAFRCPTCARDVHSSLPGSAGQELVSNGARVAVELPEDGPPARPLELDDVIDLHQALAADSWFDALEDGGALG